MLPDLFLLLFLFAGGAQSQLRADYNSCPLHPTSLRDTKFTTDINNWYTAPAHSCDHIPPDLSFCTFNPCDCCFIYVPPAAGCWFSNSDFQFPDRLPESLRSKILTENCGNWQEVSVSSQSQSPVPAGSPIPSGSSSSSGASSGASPLQSQPMITSSSAAVPSVPSASVNSPPEATPGRQLLTNAANTASIWELFVLGVAATIFSISSSNNQNHPSIKVSLASKSDEWIPIPPELELINLIHELGNNNMFELIASLKSKGWLKEERKDRSFQSFYAFWMNENQDLFINEEAKDLIKASLATHTMAPKIQAFYHYYENSVSVTVNNGSLDSSCACWVDWGGLQICDAALIATLFHKQSSVDESIWKSPQRLMFDFNYKDPDGISSAAKVAVFYADVFSVGYIPFYEALQSLALENENFNFIMRLKPSSVSAPKKMSISGYGVEMAVKNTEYKAVDDRKLESDLKDNAPEDDDESKILYQDASSATLLEEEEPSIQKLSKGRIKSIAPLSIAFAIGTEDPFSSLVKVSLDFPKVAHLLKKDSASSSISQLSKKMIQTVTGETQLLLLNGMALDVERFNAFEILRLMKSENLILSQLESHGLNPSKAFELLSSPLASSSRSFDWGDCFNTKSDSILWINDLEKDQVYRQFPKSLYALMQQMYPNQFKYVRKNIFSVVFFVDLTNVAHLAEIVKVSTIIKQQAPLRFGVVPILNSRSAGEELKLLAIAVNEIRKLDKSKLVPFASKLSEASKDASVTLSVVRSAFSAVVGKSLDISEATVDDELADIIAINERLGVSKNGAIFGNGHYFPLTSDWTQSVIETYFKMISYLTEAVMTSRVTDQDDVYEHFMTLPNVYERRHPSIFPDKISDLNLVSFSDVDLSGVNWLYSEGDKAKPWSVSVIVYGDFTRGVNLITESISALRGDLRGTRMSFIDTSIHACDDLNAFIGSNPSREALDDFVKGLQKNHVCKNPFDPKKSIKAALHIPFQASGCFVNGRRVPFLVDGFTSQDFHTLVNYESSNRINGNAASIRDAFFDLNLDRKDLADRILYITSILSKAIVSPNTGEKIKRTSVSMFDSFRNSKIHIKSGPEDGKFKFIAAIQPISEKGQKVLSVLDKLKRMAGVSIDIFAMGVTGQGDSEKLPLMRFYTFVFETEPHFNAEGELLPSFAVFPKLPPSSLLTLGMDVPGSWLVRPKKSIYDLDNIKLSSVPLGRNVEAEFSLEYLLVEGHCSEKDTQMPPRGLQFILGTPKREVVDESITMANLGYIQLKGGPGVWHMKTRQGRSSDVYKVDSLQSGIEGDSSVIVDSFEGVTLHPLVSKKIGMEDADVLVDDADSSLMKNVWNNIKSTVFKVEKLKTINVFTVASGHLYERFMAIMMLSVKKQSKHPVKFWLIENFLSPDFLGFLPHLAEAFDFDYELVTYKWPHWLRKQTEKQRIIWGYKILFLDVLFPLSLEKVIFVDADQVVRTDLIELVDLDLKGAVYGYTPFCSSRTEMDGFRFWKGGYWESHLAGRPYHISALYVIDLVKFRAIAAGDRLRQQYHMLSADPQSLSNLDQDLPNNMIHEIPMFSLPQDWLWCETWCSDESLKTAKTIDLCNNPLTKEPKLERAKRILPEWVGLDNEVAQVREAFEKSLLSSTASSSRTSSESSSTFTSTDESDESVSSTSSVDTDLHGEEL